MGPWFALFITLLQNLNELVAENRVMCGAVATIVCFAWNVITYPEGAINQFMIMLVDMIAGAFPSTPPQYQLYSMLDSFAAQFPMIGWGVVYEIFSGITGMLSIYLVVKLWRFLPFGGSS